MTPLSRAISSWQSLPEPIRFVAIETLRLAAERALSNADDDPGFAADWRAEAKGLRAAMRLQKAAEKKRKVKR